MVIDILYSVLLGSCIGYIYGLAFVEKQKRVFLYHKQYTMLTAILRIVCASMLVYLVALHHVPLVPCITSFLLCFIFVIVQQVIKKGAE